MSAPSVYTVPELSRLLGVSTSTVGRVVDRLAPPVRRFGPYRVIPASRLPEVKAELRRRGSAARRGNASA